MATAREREREGDRERKQTLKPQGPQWRGDFGAVRARGPEDFMIWSAMSSECEQRRSRATVAGYSGTVQARRREDRVASSVKTLLGVERHRNYILNPQYGLFAAKELNQSEKRRSSALENIAKEKSRQLNLPS